MSIQRLPYKGIRLTDNAVFDSLKREVTALKRRGIRNTEISTLLSVKHQRLVSCWMVGCLIKYESYDEYRRVEVDRLARLRLTDGIYNAPPHKQRTAILNLYPIYNRLTRT